MRFIYLILPLLSWTFCVVVGQTQDPCDEAPPSGGGIELKTYLEIYLTCMNWKVHVRLSACKLERLGLQSTDEIYFASDPNTDLDQISNSCKFERSLSSDFGDIVNATFDYDECNVNIANPVETFYSYGYRLNLKLGGEAVGSITRSQQSTIDFFCWYNMAPSRFLGQLHPQSQSYQVGQVLDGGFAGEVFLKAFLDSGLKREITASVPFVTIPNFIYILAEITGGKGTSMILQAETCWATPTSDPADSSRYDLIVAGCPEPTLLSTSGIDVTENYISWRVVFGMRSFLWVGFSSGQEIFIHCQLNICDSSTNSACTTKVCSSGRKRRGLSIRNPRLSHASLPPASFSVAINPLCAGDGNSSSHCEQICTVADASRQCLCLSGSTLKDDGISCEHSVVRETTEDRPLVTVVERTEFHGFHAQQIAAVGLISFVILVILLHGIYLCCTSRRDKTTTDFAKNANAYERLIA